MKETICKKCGSKNTALIWPDRINYVCRDCYTLFEGVIDMKETTKIINKDYGIFVKGLGYAVESSMLIPNRPHHDMEHYQWYFTDEEEKGFRDGYKGCNIVIKELMERLYYDRDMFQIIRYTTTLNRKEVE